MTEYNFLTYQEFRLPYRMYGNGPEVLLAFHGFGCEGSDFAVFESFLSEKYTIYAFDLFYHGKESISLDVSLPPADASIMAHMIEQLLWADKRVKFSVLGYSLGGRVALSLVQKLPHRINEIFLAAPDGLKSEWHESFVTKTKFGNYIYKHFITRPAVLLHVISLLGTSGILNKKVRNFILSNLSDTDKRKRVYQTWMVFKNLKPDLRLILYYINSKKLRVELFFGRYDKIIKPRQSKALTRKLQHKSVLHLLETGHQVLKRPEQISRIILQQ